MVPEPDLRALAARALFLFERLEGAAGCRSLPDSEPDTINARVQAWDALIGADFPPEAVAFYREWLGIDADDVARAVSPVLLPPDAPLPVWAAILGDLLTTPPDSTLTAFTGRESLPFQALWSPLAAVVSRRINDAAPQAWARLTPTAQTDIIYVLVKRIATAAAELIYPRFEAFRAAKIGPLAAFTVPGAAAIHEAFITQMHAGGLSDLFETYPVLGRIIGNRAHYWADAHAEMLNRLLNDIPLIIDQFSQKRDPGAVTAVQTGTSDDHRGGRGTAILTFESGLRVVYKARPMGMERAYNELLIWLNAQGSPITLRPLHILERDAYGWAEFAEHQPCADTAAAARYYQRVGALACLLYVLMGTDCHLENVVAAGEYPVLVDGETLLNPGVMLDMSEGDSAHDQVRRMLRQSVLGSLLLPQWITFGKTASAVDISPTGAVEPQPLSSFSTVWKYCGTDRMKPAQRRDILMPGANVLHIGSIPDGAIARLEHFASGMMEGFARMGRFILAQRDALSARDGALHGFAGQEVRYLVRHTNAYTTLFHSLFQPAFLSDGVAYSLPIEALARAYFPSMDDPTTRALMTAERAGLMRGDLPLFTTYTDSTILLTDSGACIAEDYFVGTPLDHVTNRLNKLDERELAAQLRLMEAALAARTAADSNDHSTSGERLVIGQPAADPLPMSALCAEAAAIMRQLAAEAIYGDDGGATWVTPTYDEQTKKMNLAAVPLDLYQGQAGIALFLATAAAADPGADAVALARAALHPIRAQLRDPRLSINQLGIGAGFGLGAWLYTLTRAAILLDDSVLLDEAQATAEQLTPAHIAADTHFDVLNGAAGMILALLTLYSATNDAGVLERARACGQHLLRERTATAQGFVAWDTIGEGTHWIGFSHGAAGIAYALARLYSVTGDPELREAVETAIAYEAQHFNPIIDNWPRVLPLAMVDSESAETQRVWASWCHGAPGIGLARAACAQWIDTPQINTDIRAATRATIDALHQMPSSGSLLCCGDLGRVDCLFTMGTLTGDSTAVALAQKYAAGIVSDAQIQGHYRFSSVLRRSMPPPGLFSGLAGIGYQLLRLSNPQQFPSVLLWG